MSRILNAKINHLFNIFILNTSNNKFLIKTLGRYFNNIIEIYNSYMSFRASTFHYLQAFRDCNLNYLFSGDILNRRLLFLYWFFISILALVYVHWWWCWTVFIHLLHFDHISNISSWFSFTKKHLINTVVIQYLLLPNLLHKKLVIFFT